MPHAPARSLTTPTPTAVVSSITRDVGLDTDAAVTPKGSVTARTASASRAAATAATETTSSIATQVSIRPRTCVCIAYREASAVTEPTVIRSLTTSSVISTWWVLISFALFSAVRYPVIKGT